MKFLEIIFFGTSRMGIKAIRVALEAIMGRLKWSIILERLITRVLVLCLTWLASLSTNRIYQDTVNDILKDFQNRGLTKAVAYETRRAKRNN